MLGVALNSTIFLSEVTGPSKAGQQRTNRTNREGRSRVRAEDCQAEASTRSVAGTCPIRRNVIYFVLSTGHRPVDRYVAKSENTLITKHLSCQPEPATAIRMNDHPTPAGADGHNSTEHQQRPTGFTPPHCWVSRRTQSYSCPTRPAKATLNTNAQTKLTEKGPKTVKPRQTTVLAQVHRTPS